MMAVRIEELEDEVLPALGEVDEAMWIAVSGGQPVALTRRGRAAAVVIDPETYAYLVSTALAQDGASA